MNGLDGLKRDAKLDEQLPDVALDVVGAARLPIGPVIQENRPGLSRARGAELASENTVVRPVDVPTIRPGFDIEVRVLKLDEREVLPFVAPRGLRS